MTGNAVGTVLCLFAVAISCSGLAYPKVEIPKGFAAPEPQPLQINEKTDTTELLTGTVGIGLRLATSAFVLGWHVDSILAPELNSDGKKQYGLQLGPIRLRDSSPILAEAPRPEKMLTFYDNDSSSGCRRVREMMNLLDLTYLTVPTFDNSQFPLLEDPNTGEKITGDDAIIDHLVDAYGPPKESYDEKALWPIKFRQFAMATSWLASAIRGRPGAEKQSNARPDNGSMRPIELWAYECSPFVKPVKEKLSSLGIPHTVVSCSRGSSNRDRMVDKTGRFQVPYIVDPNTGIDMYESAEIVEYLDKAYTVQ